MGSKSNSVSSFKKLVIMMKCLTVCILSTYLLCKNIIKNIFSTDTFIKLIKSNQFLHYVLIIHLLLGHHMIHVSSVDRWNFLLIKNMSIIFCVNCLFDTLKKIFIQVSAEGSENPFTSMFIHFFSVFQIIKKFVSLLILQYFYFSIVIKDK